jgi:hypothetical protein
MTLLLRTISTIMASHIIFSNDPNDPIRHNAQRNCGQVNRCTCMMTRFGSIKSLLRIAHTHTEIEYPKIRSQISILSKIKKQSDELSTVSDKQFKTDCLFKTVVRDQIVTMLSFKSAFLVAE